MPKTSRPPRGRAARAPAPRRPVPYRVTLARRVCDRIAEGETVRSVCADRAMPRRADLREWLRRHPEFRALYLEAQREAADALAAEALDLARAAGADDLALVKMRLAELHWQAARLRPAGEPATAAAADAQAGSSDAWLDRLVAALRAAAAGAAPPAPAMPPVRADAAETRSRRDRAGAPDLRPRASPIGAPAAESDDPDDRDEEGDEDGDTDGDAARGLA